MFLNCFSKDTCSEHITYSEHDGSHHFIVRGYSLLKGMGHGKYISSRLFKAGGYYWAIHVFPDGCSRNDEGHLSIHVVLKSKPSLPVRALCEMKILDQSGKGKYKILAPSNPEDAPEHVPFVLNVQGRSRAFRVEKSFLENSDYMKDGCLVVSATVRVVKYLSRNLGRFSDQVVSHELECSETKTTVLTIKGKLSNDKAVINEIQSSQIVPGSRIGLMIKSFLLKLKI